VYIDVFTVTNAAGGLNSEYAVGDIVVLSDVRAPHDIVLELPYKQSQHLNLAGLAGIHPLRGPNADEFGVRFPPLSDAYDLDMRRRAHNAWKQIEHHQSRRLHEGVYSFVGGPR